MLERLRRRHEIRRRPSRYLTSVWRWRYFGISLVFDLLLLLSCLEVVLVTTLFRFGSLPNSLLIGGILTSFAVSMNASYHKSTHLTLALQAAASLALGSFHLVVSHRYRSSQGERDHQSLLQNTVLRASSVSTLIWWVSSLTGSYIFSSPILACHFEPLDTVLGQIGTPCSVYELNLLIGAVALYELSSCLVNPLNRTNVPLSLCSAVFCIFLIRSRRPFIYPRQALRQGYIESEQELVASQDPFIHTFAPLSLRTASNASACSTMSSTTIGNAQSTTEEEPHQVAIKTEQQDIDKTVEDSQRRLFDRWCDNQAPAVYMPTNVTLYDSRPPLRCYQPRNSSLVHCASDVSGKPRTTNVAAKPISMPAPCHQPRKLNPSHLDNVDLSNRDTAADAGPVPRELKSHQPRSSSLPRPSENEASQGMESPPVLWRSPSQPSLRHFARHKRASRLLTNQAPEVPPIPDALRDQQAPLPPDSDTSSLDSARFRRSFMPADLLPRGRIVTDRVREAYPGRQLQRPFSIDFSPSSPPPVGAKGRSKRQRPDLLRAASETDVGAERELRVVQSYQSGPRT